MAIIYDLTDCGYFNNTSDDAKSHGLTIYAKKQGTDTLIIQFDNVKKEVYKYKLNFQYDASFFACLTPQEIQGIYGTMKKKGWI